MTRDQRRLGVHIAGTGLAGLAVLAWALPRVDPVAAVVAILAVAAAEYFATHFREGVDVSLSNVIVLVALLLGGPELAVVAAVGIFPVVALVATDRRWLRSVFNAGQYAVSAAAAGVTFMGLSRLMGGDFPDGPSLIAIAVASVVFAVVNNALVSLAVALASSERFLSAFVSVRLALLLQAPYVGITVLVAVIVQAASAWALLFMAVPTLIARYGLLAFQRLDEAYDRLVRSFVKAIEIKDLYTRGHSERVAELSVLVAEELGISYEERRLTRYAALLHDVGKIAVPGCILNKPGPLTDEEFAEIKKHPTTGAAILHDIDFLSPAINIVRFHHERLDGRGYPHGVSEEQLSDIVRIVTTVDAFDAMTSTRSYRKALSVDEAVAELRRCAGRQFDPRMVEALAIVADRVEWKPTVEFASEAKLDGHDIPVVGTAQERIEATTSRAVWVRR